MTERAMNGSTERHQRTLKEWTHSAIRAMLRSPDPIAVYSQQDRVIRDRIESQLSQHRRATLGSLATIALLAVGVVIIVPAPLVFLPLGGVALILIITLREHRLARLGEAVCRFEHHQPVP